MKRATMNKQNWEMSQNEELESIIAQVKHLSIDSVLSRYGIKPERYTGRRILALCPFHMDEHVGSFSMDTESNTCWCYACNNGGDAIRSMQKIWNKEFTETVLQIACDFNIIDAKTYSKLVGVEYERQGKEVEIKMERAKKRPSNETYQTWTKIYEFMRDWFGLLDEDRVYLKETRFVPEDRLGDYFSINTTDPRLVSRFIFDLKSKFPDLVEQIVEVPGFFEVKNKDKWQIGTTAVDAIGMLLRNASGQVIAVQLRDKNENATVRYKYFSYKPGRNNKFMRKGGSVGTPIDVIVPANAKNKIAIVEGRFKAEILAQEGFITLSVQGVQNFSGIEKDIKEIESIIGSKINDIYIFYDGDQLRNGVVYQAGIKLGAYIKEKAHKTPHFLIWDPELGKGIDDLLFNGHKFDAKCFGFEYYSSVFEASYEEAETCTGIKGRAINSIKKEERQKFFDAFEESNRRRFKL